MEYSEEVTKDKLEFYIKYSKTIEIVPVENEEPIFVLKDFSPIDGIAVIRKGKFILGIQVYDYWIPKHSKNGIFSAEPIPTEYVSSDEDYLNLHKSRIRPSKEFSMQSILDDRVKIGDAKYTRPARDFLRKFGALGDKRGKYPRSNTEKEERCKFVVEEYKKLKGKNLSYHKTILVIYDRWWDRMCKRYGVQGADKHKKSPTTIRRDLDSNLEKNTKK